MKKMICASLLIASTSALAATDLEILPTRVWTCEVSVQNHAPFIAREADKGLAEQSARTQCRNAAPAYLCKSAPVSCSR